jgi:hypothetical protein
VAKKGASTGGIPRLEKGGKRARKGGDAPASPPAVSAPAGRCVAKDSLCAGDEGGLGKGWRTGGEVPWPWGGPNAPCLCALSGREKGRV